MPGVATAAIAIGAAIASAATAVAATVTAAIAAAASALATAVGTIAAGIASAVSAVTSSIAALSSTIASTVAELSTTIGASLAEFGGTVVTFTQNVAYWVSAFAEAIHWKVIVAVHDIAYMVSPEYHKMVDGIWHSFSEVARSVGAGAEIFNLMLQNSRNLVHSTGAIMGKSYDLNEVTWFKELSRISKKFEEQIDVIGKRPYALFRILDDYTTRPNIGASSGFMQGVFNTVKYTADAAEALAEDVTQFNHDLDKFVSDLPESIREEIKPYTDNITDSIDNFIQNEYRPLIRDATRAINILNSNQSRIDDQTSDIVDRIDMPGDLLKNVDHLISDYQIDQERKITEVADREKKRQSEEAEGHTRATYEELYAIQEAIEYKPEPPPWEAGEPKKPQRPAGKEARKDKTPFVGDY